VTAATRAEIEQHKILDLNWGHYNKRGRPLCDAIHHI
jgi:hypothetical protein